MKKFPFIRQFINSWVDECHENSRYGLKGRIIIEENSKYQRITIVESKKYGKALLLDNCWMTAEKQDKQYHECLVHPALTASECIENILLIGGGDGGAARECLKYKDVKSLDLVEIDNQVINMSKKYLPSIGGSAWQDKRLHLHIQNGIDWVKKSKDNTYDIIIIDGADPVGPAKGLFDKEFYRNCKRIIKDNGIFATQSESPEAFKDVHINTVRILREVFDYADPLYGNVPLYPSGWWSWTFAAFYKPKYKYPLSNRIKEISSSCEIWSPQWQEGSFKSIPAFLERGLNQ